MILSELELVFGPESRGDTAETRAKTSKRRFVRGQAQLGEDRPAATGVRLEASWALHLFGYDKLKQAVVHGAARINASADEPARTLRERREALGLAEIDVARGSGLTAGEVRRAEMPGEISEIRKLQWIGQSLGLNDEKLGSLRGAEADSELAVRLRTLRNANGPARLSASLVLKLAEAAWTISRQDELTSLLGAAPQTTIGCNYSEDFAPPVWQRGYELAERARSGLGISTKEPIQSVRALIDKLGIPLVQAELGQRFAGATVVNGDVRGLVVNIEGDNQNPWVRRMTLCHELGHLLFDPPAQLNRLHVDRYQDIASTGGDPVESRANAFAIAFLAPRDAVHEIIKSVDGVREQLEQLMVRYGIAATAARYHLANVHRLLGYGDVPATSIPAAQLPQPGEDWLTSENWTADYFPIQGVPVGRSGRFAGLVAAAAQRQLISTDTAALWLRTSPSQVESRLSDILSLTAPDLAAD